MLKWYVKASETLRHLRADVKGVVSFEYVIVAAAIVTAVTTAFVTNAGGISGKLEAALALINLNP